MRRGTASDGTPDEPLKRPGPRRPAAGAGAGIPIPKEHGAWAVLYAPILSAVLVAGRVNDELGWFLLTVTGLFLAHEPLARLARAGWPLSGLGGRPASWWLWAAADLSACALGGAVLWRVNGLSDLAILGVVTAALLAVHLRRVGLRDERTVTGEIVGIAGLTLTLPGALYVLEREWSLTAARLWLLHFLYFTGGIFYVKAVVTRFVGRPEAKRWAVVSDLYHVGAVLAISLAGAAGWMPPWSSAALIPALTRALVGVRQRPEPQLNMRRIGYTEVVFTLVFVAVAALAFGYGG